MNAAADYSTDRVAGVLSIATSVAAIALLAAHPAEQASTFAQVVQEEARNQQQNLIVHGGYMVVLSVQILCFSLLSNRVGGARLAARAGITFFAIGAAWMCVSLLFDGLVTPAIALRYADQPDAVRPLFVLVGAVVRFAMPLGLGFQALAILCWGAAMASSRLHASAGGAFLLGAAVVVAVAASAFGGMPMAVMAAFAALSLWALLAGGVLLRGQALAPNKS